MVRLFLSFLILLTSSAGASEIEELHLAGDIRAPLPDNWVVGSPGRELPCQLIYLNDGAEILIFQSTVDGDEMITSESQLKMEVQDIVDEVVLTLPEAQLLISTGFNENDRAGFLLEFTSIDSITNTVLRHRLKGILYRHPDDYQMLFTIWGKCTANLYAGLARDMLRVEQGFVYEGEQTKRVFDSGQSSFWMLAFLMLIIITLLFFKRSRPSFRNKMAAGNAFKSSSWRCECGQLNRGSIDYCSVCNRARTSSPA